jgi:hypothetical protein
MELLKSPYPAHDSSPLFLHNVLGERREASFSTQWLVSDNLVQSFNDLSQFLWRCSGNHLPNPFDRKGANLADFHPGFLLESSRMKFKR